MTHDPSHVQIGVLDLDGVMRGKYLSRAKFDSIRTDGGAFCSVLFGWDLRDTLYENGYTGWHNGFPDDEVRVVPDSEWIISETGERFYLLEFSGEGAFCCPRRVAGRVLDRAAEMGFEVKTGFEYEAFAFVETPQSAEAKGYRGLTSLTPSTGGYSSLRQNVFYEFFTGILALAERLGAPIEALHPEFGAGAIEFALCPSIGLAGPDRAAVLKTFAKAWAQRQGISLCFMAKPALELPGCGGHLHMSLRRAGLPVFFNPVAANELSEIARHFLGGQQKYMPELLAMASPTVNAFTRLTPGFWAPTSATWGIDNRTCALRIVGGSAEARRVEYRVASADANPYLVFAAALASGLAGIERKIQPTAPIATNAYEVELPSELAFPANLGAAAERFANSKMAQEWFGSRFVEHYATTRHNEERQYRAHVSDWELKRYFEMI